jgi:predicted ATPase
MSIIIEGVDNSGKSTLAKKLATRFGMFIEHPGPAAESADQAVEQAMVGYIDSQVKTNAIFDRVPFISEIAYGKHKMSASDKPYNVIRDKLIYESNAILIYCRPPTAKIVDMESHKEKEYDTEEHLEFVYQNLYSIINRYDDYFEGIPHIEFDWTSCTEDEIEEFVNRIGRLMSGHGWVDFRNSFKKVNTYEFQ